MVYDTNLMLRSSGDLTATATGSAIDYGGGARAGSRKALVFKIVVPKADGTNPTCDMEIHESDTSAFTVVRRKVTLAQITAAGVYRCSIRPYYRYMRYKATIGGTSPDFGVVQIGPEMRGEHNLF